MTSTEFIENAKMTVACIMELELGINVPQEQIQLVWFAHELGHKKCTMYAPEMGPHYAEVTYNRDNGEMYVDIYKKVLNMRKVYPDFTKETCHAMSH